MSSLIVLLPSSDILGPSGWEAVAMPFALLGRKGEVLDTGQVQFEALPQADATVLVVAARDTLLLNAKLPPVTGPRLRRVLPNVVEEYLIQDSQTCHIAIDPELLDSGERCLAVLDRKWFACVVERFAQAGHRRLRAVPLIHCLAMPDEGEAQQRTSASDELSRSEALVSDALRGAAFDGDGSGTASRATLNATTEAEVGASATGNSAEATLENASLAMASVLIMRCSRMDEALTHDCQDYWVELACRQDSLGFGMSVNAAQLDATLAELAARQPLTVYMLDVATETEPGIRRGVEPGVGPGAEIGIEAGASPLSDPSPAWAQRRVSLATVAVQALACRFDLCQFEFANAGRNSLGTGGLKPWRVALGFVGASLLISIIALNVQWFQLRHRRDALEAQMTALVKVTFPDTRVILDPHAQMASELARLGDKMGELHGDDFLALAGNLAHALGPISSASIAELNYSSGALDVTFKSGTDIDEDGLKRRFAANGLSAEEDNGKWTVKPAQLRPH